MLAALAYLAVSVALVAAAVARWGPDDDGTPAAAEGTADTDEDRDAEDDTAGPGDEGRDDPEAEPPARERVPVDSGAGIVWTMVAVPGQRPIDIPAPGGPPLPGAGWTAIPDGPPEVVGGAAGEFVTVVRLDGRAFSVDDDMRSAATNLDSRIGPIEDATVDGRPARTASMEGALGRSDVRGRMTAVVADDRLLFVFVLSPTQAWADEGSAALLATVTIA